MFAENCDYFVILNTFVAFRCEILSGGTFNFPPNLANFHEYTLNMTSYQVTESIAILRTKIQKFKLKNSSD